MIRPGLIIHARLGSKRCQRKIVRPFADSSLIEIALEKLANLETDLPKYFAAGEDELESIARSYPEITYVQRPAEALVVDGPPSVVCSHLNRLPETHFLFINPCHPLVPPQAWLAAVAEFEEHRPTSLTSVFRNNGWFYGQDGVSINCKDEQVHATQDSPWIYEVAHAFHILDKRLFLTNDRPWSNGPEDPRLFEIARESSWDIDTPDQFDAVERLYEKRHGLAPATAS